MYTVRNLPNCATDSVTKHVFLAISAGAGKGRVPWTELQRAQGDYIKEEYLPRHVTLKQYYHLRQKDVRAILGHWVRRKAAGKVPFRFKKAAKAVHKRTRTMTSEGNDGNAHMGPSEEGSEQHDEHGSQASGDMSSQGDDGSDSPTEEAHPNQGLGNVGEIPVSWLVKFEA
jgi:hypothetical protein